MPSTTTPAGTEQLAAVNRRILSDGETLPTVTLKDGSRVQTGTVAAMLHNIARYNAGERGEVERELALAVPTLARIGLFELFSPEEWLAGDNPGRRFVGGAARAWLDGEQA
ncbi:hypothetical protein EV683_12625 [Crenobacter luteus]|uniref:DUF7709 family protein n=1 Tax=Crenobacter luteus TaxID=1452487 RepID=UPI00104B77E1|nr:hypothetical protein [Crenobacter luteus]TCP10265.1 hypothetical protein EV683_12625 [Crenobacter luteus]